MDIKKLLSRQRTYFVLSLVLIIGWFVVYRTEKPLLHSEVTGILRDEKPSNLSELLELLKGETSDTDRLDDQFASAISGRTKISEWYLSEVIYTDFSYTVWNDPAATNEDFERACWEARYVPKMDISKVVLVGCYGDGKLTLGVDISGKAMQSDFFIFAGSDGRIIGWYDGTPYADHENSIPENSNYMYPQKAAEEACWSAKKHIEQFYVQTKRVPIDISELVSSGIAQDRDYQLKYYEPPTWSGEMTGEGKFFGQLICEPVRDTFGSRVGIYINQNQYYSSLR